MELTIEAYVSKSRDGRQADRCLITNINIFLSGSDVALMGQRYSSVWGVKCQVLGTWVVRLHMLMCNLMALKMLPEHLGSTENWSGCRESGVESWLGQDPGGPCSVPWNGPAINQQSAPGPPSWVFWPPCEVILKIGCYYWSFLRPLLAWTFHQLISSWSSRHTDSLVCGCVSV